MTVARASKAKPPKESSDRLGRSLRRRQARTKPRRCRRSRAKPLEVLLIPGETSEGVTKPRQHLQTHHQARVTRPKASLVPHDPSSIGIVCVDSLTKRDISPVSDEMTRDFKPYIAQYKLVMAKKKRLLKI